MLTNLHIQVLKKGRNKGRSKAALQFQYYKRCIINRSLASSKKNLWNTFLNSKIYNLPPGDQEEIWRRDLIGGVVWKYQSLLSNSLQADHCKEGFYFYFLKVFFVCVPCRWSLQHLVCFQDSQADIRTAYYHYY